ncbi:MAG: glycosyltransferase family 4 protein [Phycisphaerales bacterium JB063]
MRFLLVTDAWAPQVNGVVRTWEHVTREMRAAGHTTEVIHPGLMRTVGAPRYPEIRLSILPGRRTRAMIQRYRPDAVHIATEGPIGMAARRYCVKRNLPFTTSYHTQFPLYLRRYFGVPTAISYRFIRWFHGKAQHTLVPTQRVGEELNANGLRNVVVWSRGVDIALFHPGHTPPAPLADLPRPIFVYAGRVAIEKNISAFLELDLPGSKLVIGDGPARNTLEKQHPDAHFVGYQFGEQLASHYAAGDVFVFPSRTDTFGVVMLEANAAGLPVAAYPVTGPIDVVQQGQTGYVCKDLRTACLEALKLEPGPCVAYAKRNSWARCAQTVIDHLATITHDSQPLAGVGLPDSADAATSQ